MTLVRVSLALGMYLFAYKPAEAPPASKPPGLKIKRRFARAIIVRRTGFARRRSGTARVSIADFGAVHLRRILEHIREPHKGVRDHRLIGHAGIENVGNRAGYGVGTVPALDWRRIGHLVGIAPPQADRELLNLALVVVADEDLGVVADVPIAANRPLPVVLIEDFGLDVVISAGAVRIRIGSRKELGQGKHVRIDTLAVRSSVARRDRGSAEGRDARR